MANLAINRGTTFIIDFLYKKDGVASSLVGATVRFTVKTEEFDDNTTDSDALILKNVTDGDALGQAEIVIDPEDTATIEPGKYYYDIKVEEADSTIYKVIEGRFAIDGSPTNRLS